MSLKNPEERNTYRKERHNRRMNEARKLLGNECSFCTNTENLQFDHIDPNTKLYKISELARGRWEKLLTELSKCQLLCHQCHINKSREEVPIRHGTLWRYAHHKCKCESCVRVGQAYQREYYKSKHHQRSI